MSDCMSDIPAVFLLTDERLNELAQADLGRVLPTEYANLRDKSQQITSNSDKLILVTSELAGLREDLGALKSGQEWLVRLVAGAVITAVIGVLFALLRTMPG